MLRNGDAIGAATAAEKGLESNPDDANLLCLAARANLVERRLGRTRKLVERALSLYPGFANAFDVHGDLLLVEGRLSEALTAYEQVQRLDPARRSTAKKIEKTRQLAVASGQASEGADNERLRRSQMAYADEIRQAEQFERSGAPEKAEAIYRRILRKDPDHVEACRLLAGIAAAHERYREAAVFLQRATELAPDYPRAWVDLANVQRHLEDFDAAIECAEKVLALAPERAESYMVYGSVLGVAGKHDEAIATYRKALQLDPSRAGALCSMAHHLKTIGKQDEAVATYRECIALQPDHGEAFWSLANLKTFRFSDAELDAMQALLTREDLSDESRVQINNALGLEFEARKEFDRAFTHFSDCNAVRRKTESYDPVDTESTNDRIVEQFTEEFLAQAGGPDVHPAPIFVVGLPRSGSTLIEQILASHSQVDGTHELSDLSKVVRGLRRGARRDQRFPEITENLQRGGWARLGNEYIGRTAKYRAGAPYFIDKNPNNFVFIGLLKLAMPNAKIINARRHPLDSCLGSFKQLFASGQPFSYDIVELGEYYLEYQRLMDHWHSVLPGFVLDVHYEEVVANLEQQVHRLLDFCGLPFEDACLRFHETERAVKTASSEQVRQPIYSSSVNLWRNYEGNLQTLIEILQPLLEKLPKNDRPLVTPAT